MGTAGAGKSTLSRVLARRIGAVHIELDPLFRSKPGGTRVTNSEFQKAVRDAMCAAESSGRSWVTDGNYSPVSPIYAPKADMIVWLDYDMGVNVYRIFQRRFERWWGGSIHTSFFEWFQFLLRTIKKHPQKQARFSAGFLANPPAFALRGGKLVKLRSDCAIVRLTSPAETNAWLSRYVDEHKRAGA